MRIEAKQPGWVSSENQVAAPTGQGLHDRQLNESGDKGQERKGYSGRVQRKKQEGKVKGPLRLKWRRGGGRALWRGRIREKACKLA